MEKQTTLAHFINQFFRGAPPLSLDEIETETQGFMSFYETFLEINLFNVNIDSTISNFDR